MPKVETHRLAYFDNAREYHEVVQIWAEIPGTGVMVIVSVQPVEIDPTRVPDCPTRPM